jgi:MerR family transcriptional regulator, copper efflux regulator
MREPIPIACSLTASEQADRGNEFAEVLGRGLLRREETARGVRLRFHRSPGLQEDLAELIGREKECCPYFDFQIRVAGEEVVLEVGAPPEARPIVERLFAEATDR